MGSRIRTTTTSRLRSASPMRLAWCRSERLIADFRAQRVASEVIEFSKIADITRKLEERALSNEVITPGKTSQADLVWWLEEQRKAMGLERGWRPSVYLSPPDGVEIGNSNRVIQRGDVMQIDYGIGRNNFFTDIKRFAYVLREGETEGGTTEIALSV